MPELRKESPSLRMNSADDLLPAFDLLAGIKAGSAQPSPAGDGDVDPLGDEEAAVRSALPIVFRHQVAGNGIRLDGTGAREGSHHHAMLQLHGPKLDRSKQLQFFA